MFTWEKKKITVLYNIHKLHVIQTNQKTPRGNGEQEGPGTGKRHLPAGSGSGAPGQEPRDGSPGKEPREGAPRSLRSRSAPPRARHRRSPLQLLRPRGETRHGRQRDIAQSVSYFCQVFYWELNIFNNSHVINSLRKGMIYPCAVRYFCWTY